MKKELATIIIIGFLLTNTINGLRHFDHKLSPDQTLYHAISESILDGSFTYEFGGREFDFGEEVSPAYSTIVAVVTLLTGNFRLTFIVQVFFNLLVLVIFYNLLRNYTNNAIASIFIFGLALYYPIWAYNFHLLFEISTILFLSFSIYYLWKFLELTDNKYLYISAVFTGITIFINNRFIFHFLFLVTIVGILVLIKQNVQIKNNIKALLKYAAIVILLLAPWHVRQISHYNELIIFTPMWTDVAHKSTKIIPPSKVDTDVDVNPSRKPFKSYEEIMQNVDGANSGLFNDFSEKKYLELKNKYYNSKWYDKYLDRAWEFWRIASFDYNYNYYGDSRILPPYRPIRNLVQISVLLPLYIFGLAGVYFAFRYKDKLMLIVFGLITSHFILHVLVHFIDRYRYTIFPLLFIIGAYGFYHLYQIGKHKFFNGAYEK